MGSRVRVPEAATGQLCQQLLCTVRYLLHGMVLETVLSRRRSPVEFRAGVKSAVKMLRYLQDTLDIQK
jgi:hypothetical protein